jgi:hypothetical protein
MDFVIDRSKWRCGGVEGSSDECVRGRGIAMMRNPEGFMCCLGQVSCQLGVPADALSGCWYPRTVSVRNQEFRDRLAILLTEHNPVACDSELASLAANVNDNPVFTDDERESRLAALFAKHGHTIKFTGEYVKPDCIADLPGEGK